MQEIVLSKERTTNIKHHRHHELMKDGIIVSSLIQEIARIIDAKEIE